MGNEYDWEVVPKKYQQGNECYKPDDKYLKELGEQKERRRNRKKIIEQELKIKNHERYIDELEKNITTYSTCRKNIERLTNILQFEYKDDVLSYPFFKRMNELDKDKFSAAIKLVKYYINNKIDN